MSNYHFKEKDMSLKAKGLLSFMLSLPDDWDYSMAGLVTLLKENETAIKTALKELQDFGYVRIDKIYPNNTDSGRIEYIYNVFEQPIQEKEKQALENLPLENQPVENHVQLNTKQLNTKITKDISKDISTKNKGNFSDSSSLLKSSVIEKSKKKRKTEKEKKLDMLYKKCAEYNVSDNVVDLLERFITGLLEDKKRVTEEKVDAILMRLSKVSEQQQIKAIKFSLEKAYYDIDPEWLNNSYNKNNGNPAIRTKSTSTQEGREEYFRAYREGKCKTF